MKTSKILAATALAAVVTLMGTAANAHTVTFAWTDNGNGTVTLWNEHWHGDHPFPCNEGVLCSANGGLTISGDGTNNPGTQGLNPFTVQWAGTLNNVDRDVLVSNGTLTGYSSEGLDAGGGAYDDWIFTQPLVIGDGYWWFFTGTTCCIDTMATPVLVHLQGIGSVDPGTGPGAVDPSVPEPALLSLLALGAVPAVMRRRFQR